MKKLILILSLTLIFSACENTEEDRNTCLDGNHVWWEPEFWECMPAIYEWDLNA